MRSRTTGDWLISATRPLRDAQGRLLGVIAAAVEPPCVDQLWRSISLGDGGSVAWIRRDSTLLMRSPFDNRVRPFTYRRLAVDLNLAIVVGHATDVLFVP